MGRLVIIALALCGLLAGTAGAAADRRVALVIGNASYQETGKLANPVNDAIDIAAKLREVGFEVIEGEDLGKRELERKIGDFADALKAADVGLFYYAGHGLQIEGRNYIVPVDARLDVQVKLQLETVPIDEVLDIVEQQAKTSIVFLDACRNNPFVPAGKTDSRSAKSLQGLAQFDTSRGSFIAFSTAPFAVAMDGSGRNSPFAAAMLRHMAEPGQSINDMMIAVRRDVLSETNQFQRPYEQGSLGERFEFVPSGAPVAPPKPVAAPSVQVSSLERSLGDSKASIETFLRNDYLAPNAAALPDTLRRIYSDGALIYGAPYPIDAIVKVKSDWFAQWSSWTLAMDQASLQITPKGDDHAAVAFAMSYDYIPKSAATARATGKARVALELEKVAGQWRISSETSAPVN